MITEQQTDKPVSKAHRAVVEQYFKAFNTNDFTTAAGLFSAEGELHPPFDEAIVGPTAIAAYLQQEASKMKAYPKSIAGADREQVEVIGQVDAVVFKVGVRWTFSLTEAAKIRTLSIRLLASMKELLTMRSDR
ncbi:MAG: nuclear transport factor 2 family protein [Leptolyngbyaceae cyanobacterium]